MATLFTRILSGELPGRFVWKDDACFSILTINPLRPGHVLVIPRREVDHWIDLEPDELARLMDVARTIGRAIQATWRPEKVGLMIVGLEVRHVHLHVSPIWKMADLDFALADAHPAPAALDEAASRLRDALRRMGAGASVPAG